MKKTVIVSCYFIHNYGSMLQAYATQKVLDKFKIENETINVDGFIKQFRKAQYSYIIHSGFTSDIFRDRLGKAKNVLIKKFVRNDYTRSIRQRDIKFDEFANNWIRKSDIYTSLTELSKKCSVNYDAVLIGSDQLWLPANIAADYYTLNFVPKELNSVAYATSFGVSELPNDAAEMAKKFLPRIKHISVREEAGQKLVKKLTGRNVPVVCDPTLLFTGQEWMEIQQPKRIVEQPYIFCYFIGGTQIHRDFVKRLKKETGLKVVALTHVDHYMKSDEGYADYTPYNIGPSEFLNLIRNADYVCTDSFHSTVFSILYKKDFFEFKRYTENTKQSTNSRLDTLFNLVDIHDRTLTGNENIRDCLSKTVDYQKAHENLRIAREKSYQYLIEALSIKINDSRSYTL